MTAFDAAAGVVRDAIARGIVPAAVTEVGAGDGVYWRHAAGRLAFDAEAATADEETPFDLASLTKVLATTSVVMQLIDDQKLRLDEPIAASFAEWRGADREHVTIRDLLEHSAGLPTRLVDAPPTGRREFEHEICALPLEYEPRSRSIYSDLGFILLGFLVADRGGASLAKQFDALRVRLKPDATYERDSRGVRLQPPFDLAQGGPERAEGPDLTFDLPTDRRRAAAPTQPLDDDPRRGRRLVGEVHDAYAAALGGVAGHAGLFGTASAVGAFARTVLRAASGANDEPSPFSRANVEAFTTKSRVPGSSRALGWDTMLTTSSCGTTMSPAAFGHVGFTGTSLWIDPDRDRYYVLLTNRACGGGSPDAMRTVRRAFHDALADV